jgi:hypothetical protein
MSHVWWVIKSKNACKDTNKTIFLEFLYLKMLNDALYFFNYLYKYDFIFIFFYFWETWLYAHK